MRTLVNIVVFMFTVGVVATVSGAFGAIGPLEVALVAFIAVGATWWLDRRRQTAHAV